MVVELFTQPFACQLFLGQVHLGAWQPSDAQTNPKREYWATRFKKKIDAVYFVFLPLGAVENVLTKRVNGNVVLRAGCFESRLRLGRDAADHNFLRGQLAAGLNVEVLGGEAKHNVIQRTITSLTNIVHRPMVVAKCHVVQSCRYPCCGRELKTVLLPSPS